MPFHKLQTFVSDTSNGIISPSWPISLPNLNHNMIHNISFTEHCDHLCKEHNTNSMRLLCVIQQKLNGDMILRCNKTPVLNDKIKSAISEWGEQIEPLDLFRCPEDHYDTENVTRLSERINQNDQNFQSLNEIDFEEADSDLYETLDNLKRSYHEIDEDLSNNLLEIEKRRDEYTPQYRNILTDLSTRPKSYYMDSLLDDKENEMISQKLNQKVNREIPEKMNVIFLNTLLIPSLIAKCMENSKNECLKMKELIGNKQGQIEDIMTRVGPSVPLSDSIMHLLNGVSEYFKDTDDGLPSDDDDEDDEEDDDVKLQGVLNQLVSKRSENEMGNNMVISDRDDYNEEDVVDDGSGKNDDSGGDVYFLKVDEDGSINGDGDDDMGEGDMEDDKDDEDKTIKRDNLLSDEIAFF